MQSTFGSPASTSASPFGSFKLAAGTSAFGAPPAFGAATSTQPTTGGGLFGSSNTSGGLFGGTTTAPAPAFGATSSFGFGGNTSGGLFGANNTSTELFGGTQNNTGFAKPAGFGGTTTNIYINTGRVGLFGNTSTTDSGLFGQQQPTSFGGGTTGLFGQQQPTSFGGGTTGLFGNNTAGGFGQQQQANGTAHVKYNPVDGTDVIMKSGTSQNIYIKRHQCITFMKEYEGKSLEELRLEDYTAGRKGSSSAVFGFQQQENKPLFGATLEPSSPSTTPSSPALSFESAQFRTSTPNDIGRASSSIVRVVPMNTSKDSDKDKKITSTNSLQEKTIYEEPQPTVELPPLKPEQEKLVSGALGPGRPGQLLVQMLNLKIRRRDLQTLAGLNWLNDEVINFYMKLLMLRSEERKDLPKVYAADTFFYPKLLQSGQGGLRRWTMKVDIFAYDLMVVPLHLGVHWCVGLIDFRDKRINYLDSMGGRSPACLGALLQYLRDEHEDKKGAPLDDGGWKTECLTDIPQKMNGSDCGILSCTFAEFSARDAPYTFNQSHVPYLRRKVALEILAGRLLL